MKRFKVLFIWGLVLCMAFALTMVGLGSGSAEEIEVVFAGKVYPIGWDVREPVDYNIKSMLQLVEEKLVDLDFETGKIIPMLATSWKVLDDELTWEFKLREGVEFHDGAKFNAEAVEIWWEDTISEEKKWSRRSIFVPIKTMKAVDEYTLHIITKEPAGGLLAILANPSANMISPKAIQEMTKNELMDHPVGTGPFKFKEWERDRRWVAERWDGYWGGDVTNIDKITYITITEDATRAVMLETGEVDVVYSLAPPDVRRLENDPNPNIVVENIKVARILKISLNDQREPFNDVRVRWAMSYAIDREALIEHLMFGLGTIPTSHVTDTVPYHRDMGGFPYDPEKARELLAEAGYPDGLHGITFRCMSGRLPMDAELGEAVVQMINKNTGSSLKIEIVEYETMRSMMRMPVEENEMMIWFAGWGNENMDGAYDLDEPLHSDNWSPGYNSNFYKNPEYDQVVTAARYEVDQEKREQLFIRAQEIIYEDMPFVPLFCLVQSVGYRDHMKNVIATPWELVILKYAQVAK